MPAIGIENISVFGMPPVEFVQLAADLGCQHISTGLTGFAFGIYDYPIFSLRDDVPLRREMIAAMRDTGVSISLGEGCTVRADANARDLAGDLDLFAELGTPRINTVSMDPDFNRTCDEFAVMAEMCAERGLRITTELAPTLTIDSLPKALAALRQIGRPEFRLLIDTMHINRSGSRPEDIAALDPDLIDYIQVADALRIPTIPSYMEEAMFERMVPGDGELHLADWLRVLPKDRVYAIEVPQRSLALAGKTAHERLGACVAGVRRLIAEIEEKESA
jgi:sugar phosphate isomerase/epimerase